MIEVEKISKTYRPAALNPFARKAEVPALNEVSLKVARGEATALVGRNGAGKTTLLKILATLVLPDSGRAAIGGSDVVSAARDVKRKIGIVTGDERSFYWRLSGRENLILFGALHNIPRGELKGRIDGLLRELGLSEHAGLPFRSYSSGLKQRLALARCLLHEPDVLLLDEPNKGIDPLLRAKNIQYIRDTLAGEMKRTVLLATHDLEEAFALGGRTAILEKGRIAYLGRPANAAELRDEMESADS
jgi:ABC-2 type transport system ATP-binding protein